ncbi:transcriptional regulator [Geothermobacter hydrogeniphilus]|uniref:Transcriptional regulator n=1 Tax=Geothermobacter hydrogeniphilus TaxID=1969733 RepID=A0A2K2HDF2_9BACT|nr:P-II family nitrogen regulator [Geothermobacter hydrogeniphilus]PNU21316.1 transcriptional regulator [Geothermobacter hydrogeniphilus]
MKEIKAYIRTSALEAVIENLQKCGAPGVTAINVHPVGYGFDQRYSLKLRKAEVTEKFYDITKLELVCDTEELDGYVDAIVEAAHTGTSGDGLIFVSDVDEVIKIRNRSRGTNIAAVSAEA